MCGAAKKTVSKFSWRKTSAETRTETRSVRHRFDSLNPLNNRSKATADLHQSTPRTVSQSVSRCVTRGVASRRMWRPIASHRIASYLIEKLEPATDSGNLCVGLRSRTFSVSSKMHRFSLSQKRQTHSRRSQRERFKNAAIKTQ